MVDNPEGIRLRCVRTVDGVCSVTLSGWYYGKTGGLLGVYDNEPSNDLMTPEREFVADGDRFASSWAVGHCPTTFGYTEDAAATSHSDMTTCQRLFSSPSSPLQPCFNRVPAAPFSRLCLSDLRRLSNDPLKSELGPCKAAAAYIERCRLDGVEIYSPQECVSCKNQMSGKVLKVIFAFYASIYVP